MYDVPIPDNLREAVKSAVTEDGLKHLLWNRHIIHHDELSLGRGGF